ncbi:two-component system KDP operon response regulator KdpE [Croceicoccus naphthovorans]|uniref:response regulator transcription factor n=1 Tax=Croceicoccus naphthovorans TaxID=1348774 RepID=UPI00146FDB55|nr:winged helix-turn-helix domain-containing protein [Croceicoccus naphthovorans]MBB3990728.1 two-component system KDP operon response regulator KdpE [Croceicoccus naphthovorans]
MPESAFSACNAVDQLEIEAAAARITLRFVPDALAFVSLNEADAMTQIRDKRKAANTIVGLATRAWKAARIAALDAGVDEFLTMGPLEPAELAARLELLATGAAVPSAFKLHRVDRSVAVVGKRHPLTAREVDLLTMLLDAKGRYVTHNALLERCWGSPDLDRQKLRVAINRLRKRIEPDPALPRYILAEAAIGYRIGTGAPMQPAG